MRQYGNLHFLRVYDAGHMVPMDQPENALAMINRFINNDWELSAAEAPKACPYEFGAACYMRELCGTGCTDCNWSWPAGSDMNDPDTACRCMDTCSSDFHFTQ